MDQVLAMCPLPLVAGRQQMHGLPDLAEDAPAVRMKVAMYEPNPIDPRWCSAHSDDPIMVPEPADLSEHSGILGNIPTTDYDHRLHWRYVPPAQGLTGILAGVIGRQCCPVQTKFLARYAHAFTALAEDSRV